MCGVKGNVEGRVDLYLMRLSILTRCFFISRSSVFRRFNSISCWAWRREEDGRGGGVEGGGEGQRGRGGKAEARERRYEGEERRGERGRGREVEMGRGGKIMREREEWGKETRK